MDEGQKQYRLFLDGDDRGLEAIIRLYKDGLIFYLNTILHNLSVAESVAEDTFALFGIKRPADRGSASFRTWLYAVGRNLAISYLRKHKNDAALSLDEAESVSDGDKTVEDLIVRGEQNRRIHRAMKTLNPTYQQVLWLIYFENMSCREVALVMEKSTHSIETTVYRARLALKEELLKEGYFDEIQ